MHSKNAHIKVVFYRIKRMSPNVGRYFWNHRRVFID